DGIRDDLVTGVQTCALPIFTWRLHPDICRFISDTAYDGRLKPAATTSLREIVLGPGSRRLRRGTGIHFEELHHEGNTQSSEEERSEERRVGNESRKRVRREG